MRALAVLATICVLSTSFTSAHGFQDRPHRHRHHSHHNSHHNQHHNPHHLIAESHVLESSNKGNHLGAGRSKSRWSFHHDPLLTTAANNTIVNVTAQRGGAAFLPCRVGHLGDRQISWIRQRDLHVLSSGPVLYSPDQRFSVLHAAGSQDWTLHLRAPTPADNGTYECQVSTGTGIISLLVHLSVVTPLAQVHPAPSYHVDTGSPIALTCVILKSTSPPQYVHWYHNGIRLNYLRDRPDLTITTHRGGEEERVVSTLEISRAEEHHSGNYTCDAPSTLPAATTVFVTQGDKTAAVQRIDSSGGQATRPGVRVLLASLTLALLVSLSSPSDISLTIALLVSLSSPSAISLTLTLLASFSFPSTVPLTLSRSLKDFFTPLSLPPFLTLPHSLTSPPFLPSSLTQPFR